MKYWETPMQGTLVISIRVFRFEIKIQTMTWESMYVSCS